MLNNIVRLVSRAAVFLLVVVVVGCSSVGSSGTVGGSVSTAIPPKPKVNVSIFDFKVDKNIRTKSGWNAISFQVVVENTTENVIQSPLAYAMKSPYITFLGTKVVDSMGYSRDVNFYTGMTGGYADEGLIYYGVLLPHVRNVLHLWSEIPAKANPTSLVFAWPGLISTTIPFQETKLVSVPFEDKSEPKFAKPFLGNPIRVSGSGFEFALTGIRFEQNEFYDDELSLMVEFSIMNKSGNDFRGEESSMPLVVSVSSEGEYQAKRLHITQNAVAPGEEVEKMSNWIMGLSKKPKAWVFVVVLDANNNPIAQTRVDN